MKAESPGSGRSQDYLEVGMAPKKDRKSPESGRNIYIVETLSKLGLFAQICPSRSGLQVEVLMKNLNVSRVDRRGRFEDSIGES